MLSGAPPRSTVNSAVKNYCKSEDDAYGSDRNDDDNSLVIVVCIRAGSTLRTLFALRTFGTLRTLRTFCAVNTVGNGEAPSSAVAEGNNVYVNKVVRCFFVSKT